jgi:RNA polymerase sigma-70 factor (ECF subfamily)
MLRSISSRAGSESSASSNERELQLLRRVALQDRAAFKELYVIYHRRLMRFISRLTSRHELAEEIINDTLWIVWKKAAGFRAASQVSTWILGIAYRQALTTLRRAGAPVDALEMPGHEVLAEDVHTVAETRQWLDQGLALLPLEQRMVLEFTYYLGHSCEEIAAIMDCPVNTVKTRMFHARRKLRISLGELAQQRSGA